MIVPAILSFACRKKPVRGKTPVRGPSLVRNVFDLSQQPAGTTALIARYTLLAAAAVSCYFLGAGVALIFKSAPVHAATIIVAVVAGCARNLLEED